MFELLFSRRPFDDVLNSKSVAKRDPRRKSLDSSLALAPGSLQICEVHDVMAYANSYVIKAPGMPHMIACLGSHASSFMPMGNRDCSVIHPGSLVLCYISDMFMAIIVAVLPSPMGNEKLGLPDSIVAAGHAGLFTDVTHQMPLRHDSAHGYLDLSAGRPVDGLPGDWGSMNELGVGVIVGKLMASLRASDFCKLETHYEDQLLRIAAYNHQFYTAGSELEAFNDEGEWTRIEGFNPYPWEAAGVAESDPLRQTDAKLDIENAEFGLEPQEAEQIGFWRFRTFEGYLGDLRRSYVLLPKPAASPLTHNPSVVPYNGLLEEVYGVDGSYILRSAKRISLQKTVFIPVPYDIHPRDNPNGATGFDNAAGSGETLEELGETPAGSQGMASLDTHAFLAQQLLNQGFRLRAEGDNKDWAVDETDLVGGFTEETNAIEPNSSFRAPYPMSETVIVDHRTSSRYYKSKASIDILEDGSILLEDGYGASILLSHGNIEITCPGDYIVRPGRNSVTMAGHDTVIKSQDHIDITSSLGDVRMKAEKNFMILGGNAGNQGGVLIENRATGAPQFDTSGEQVNTGGLVLKASRGTLAILGDSVYMRSSTGGITIDAADTSSIKLFANTFERYLTGSSIETIATRGGEETPVEQLSSVLHAAQGVEIISPTISFGTQAISILNPYTPSGGTSIIHKGSATIEGSYGATGGFGDIDADDVNFSEATVNLRAHIVEDIQPLIVENEAAAFDEEGSFGNTETFDRIGVSFRSSEEFGVDNTFLIYESRWQAAFRRSGADTWDEKRVTAFVKDGADSGTQTMPFPGIGTWEGGDGKFVIAEDRYYDYTGTEGTPKEQGDNYEVKELEEEEGAFKGRYPVNSKLGG